MLLSVSLETCDFLTTMIFQMSNCRNASLKQKIAPNLRKLNQNENSFAILLHHCTYKLKNTYNFAYQYINFEIEFIFFSDY